VATIRLRVPSPLISAGDFAARVLDDPWAVHAEWFLEGPIAPSLNGRWRLQVALEPVGDQGVETVLPAVFIDHGGGALSGVYPDQRMSFHERVDLPAPAGTSHCSAMLTYLTPAGTPGPFAAVVDLGLLGRGSIP
jgi:hypothetical protein